MIADVGPPCSVSTEANLGGPGHSSDETSASTSMTAVFLRLMRQRRIEFYITSFALVPTTKTSGP